MSSSKHHYNLRHKDEAKSYREQNSQSEEEDDDSEDINQEDASHRSHSSRSYNSSILSSTASESFSFHDGHSPSVRSSGENPKRLYPSLPSNSPTTTRRNVRSKGSPHSSPGKPSQHTKARAKTDKNKHSLLESETSVPQKMESDSTLRSLKQLSCVLAIVLLMCWLIITKLFPSTSDDLETKANRLQEFSGKVDELKVRFPDQSSRFWRMIKASASPVLKAEGEASNPAVLLMVGEKGNDALSADIAHAIGQAFENALRSSQDVASLNLIAYPGMDSADSQKLALDKWLIDKFSSHGTVILNHIEVLEPEAALLFHGYCDSDNAPFKNAMLILLLSLEKQVENEQAAERALRKLWLSKLEEDKVGALLSRVANNIALVSLTS